MSETELLRLRVSELESQFENLRNSYENVLDERNEMCRRQDALIIAVINYMHRDREKELEALQMMLNAAMLG